MADIEKKRQQLLQKVVKKRRIKELNINCKKTEYMIASQREIPICE